MSNRLLPAGGKQTSNRSASHSRAVDVALRSVVLVGLALLCLVAGKSDTPKVRIGYCGPISQIDAAKAAGFDYMDLRTSEVAALSDADYAQLGAKLKQIDFPVLDTYLFIPGNIKLSGPNIDKDQQMAYVRLALDRVSKLGARVVAMGSGPARSYPEGFSKDEAYAQLVDFCKRLGPEARARNVIIAIEPLRPEESNLIGSLAEALAFIKVVNDPNIQLNLDYYQFEMVKEDPADILAAGDHIVHIHMANPTGRVLPLRWDEYNYAPLFANLRKIGYDREMGVEASSTDFAKEAPESIAFLRAALTGGQ
ncbi:MAG: sugar phosphate isomerase/epimerase family protein [Candidatus Acidiferrales bacterium]